MKLCDSNVLNQSTVLLGSMSIEFEVSVKINE